jgi:hypothetical protein
MGYRGNTRFLKVKLEATLVFDGEAYCPREFVLVHEMLSAGCFRLGMHKKPKGQIPFYIFGGKVEMGLTYPKNPPNEKELERCLKDFYKEREQGLKEEEQKLPVSMAGARTKTKASSERSAPKKKHSKTRTSRSAKTRTSSSKKATTAT